MKNYSQLTAFIHSVFNEPKDFIPLHDPRFIGNEKKHLNECIDSNFVSSVGEFVGRFEKMCAGYTGAKYAVAAMNGTADHILFFKENTYTKFSMLTKDSYLYKRKL
jgi:dTDP-4-amino-4,6-dideoxygalactose transaminase